LENGETEFSFLIHDKIRQQKKEEQKVDFKREDLIVSRLQTNTDIFTT